MLSNLLRAAGAGFAQPFPVLTSTVSVNDLSYFTPEPHIISFPFSQCYQDQFSALLLVQGTLNMSY